MNASLFVLTLASLAAAPQDVVYDFYSTTCGPCQRMMPIVHRLQAEGCPIQTIDIRQRPDLADRLGIQSVPTFVLVIGGQVQQQLVGMQDESTLRALLAEIPRRPVPDAVAASTPPPRPRRSLPVRLADDDSQGSKWNFHLPLPSFAGRKQNPDVVQIDQPSAPAATSGAGPAADDARLKEAIADAAPVTPAAADEPARDERPAPDAERPSRAPANPDADKMLASSVRIRVRDSDGVYFGSGVVIESTRGKSLVLTCGHILRDVKERSRIEVDVFDGNRSRTYRGSIVKFDLESDVGLVEVATSSVVTVAPIAAIEGAVRPGEPVVSIGCSQGELPSVERLRVTMLNRYQGPDTIECTGVPGQGRSGGGLFTRRGSIVGVCTNADPQSRRGVYAGLKPIHDLLRSAGLDDLIPAAARPVRESLAEAAAVKTEPPAADEPRRARVERDMEVPPPSRARRSPSNGGDVLAGRTAGEGELSPKVLEQSEVICIIRPVNQPHGASRVVIINRASRKFMAYLTGEMKDQLLPAMGHARDDGSTASSNEAGRAAASNAADARGGTDAGDSSQTTAAWKPSGSAR